MNDARAILGTLLLTVGLPIAAASAAPAPCPPEGVSRAGLLSLKEAKFTMASDDERNMLAPRLLACLDDPDPAIRDGVVFEGLSTWLRGKALRPATILTLLESLSATLSGPPDPGGFRLPFAALVLSEVARADRIEPLFPGPARDRLVDIAASSLTRVRDYRGFDNKEGWRHGVAHGSDLVLQLALNPRVGAPGLGRMMEAVATQVAPQGAVFYTFGEPERLARAVQFAHRRGLLDHPFWEAWFTSIGSPRSGETWAEAFQSLEGLSRRHNTIAFLHALSFAARSGDDEASKALAVLADRTAAQVAGR